MTDRILSFRFKQTREKITDRGGLAIKVREYTLDIDATLIESDKGDAQKSYAGTVGYHPMLGYLSDGTDHPVCSTVKFRQGNESPQTDILESLKKTRRILASNGKRLKYFRSDSAGYQSKIINECQERGIRYTITADFDSSVIEDIGRIPSTTWLRIRDREGILTDSEYAETTHLMNGSNHSFRLIVKRKRNRQIDLFDEIFYSDYYAVVTNITEEEMSGDAVLLHHQQRGNCERFIKDGKYGLNLQYVPCGTIEANRIYYTIGMLAYNVMKLFQFLILPERYSTCLIDDHPPQSVTNGGTSCQDLAPPMAGG